jgi:hypothetical protein
MEEKPDLARVVFGCSACSVRADSEAGLKHDEQQHPLKLIRICARSGQGVHVVPPPKHKQGVMKDGRFVQPWYGFRIKKVEGMLIPDVKRPQDLLLMMCDKHAKDSLSVLVDDKHAHRTLADIHSAAQATIRTLPGAKVTEDSEIELAGQKAFVVKYDYKAAQGNAKASMYYVRHEENFLVIALQDIEPYGDHDKQFKQLLDSFELLK